MKEIKLNGIAAEGKVCLVDDEDYEWLSKYSWTIIKDRKFHNFYACRVRKIKGKTIRIRMHRLILKVQDAPNLIIDHIDHNGLNNQRNNLRICTTAENTRNRKGRPKGLPGYIGVRKAKNMWYARCTCMGREYNVYGFRTEIEAAIGYNKLAKKLHGNFATVNVISEVEMNKHLIEIKDRDVLSAIMKTCIKCRVEKSIDLFNARKKSEDGKDYYCKKCNSTICSTYHNKKRKMRDISQYPCNNTTADVGSTT